MPFGGGSSAPAGASGNPSNNIPAAMAYQPAAQAGSDTGFQSLMAGLFTGLGPAYSSQVGNLFPSLAGQDFTNAFSGTPGGVSYGLAQPFVGGAGTGTLTDPNNPYYQQALQGAQGAADLSPGLLNNANLLQQMATGGAGTSLGVLSPLVGGLSPWVGGQAGPAFQNAQTQAGNISAGYTDPALGTLGALLTPTVNQAINQAGQIGQGLVTPGLGSLGALLTPQTNQAIGQSRALDQYGNQILQTAFDPQQALYNQLQNQVSQQAQAANAAAGLGGSAYGASSAGNVLSNFDINWQNQQLGRQAQGLAAAEPAFTEASALPQSVLGQFAQAGQQYGQLGSLANQLPMSVLQQGGETARGLAGLYGMTNQMAPQTGAAYAGLGGQLSNLGFTPAQGLAATAGQVPGLAQGGAALAGMPYGAQATDLSNAMQALGSYTNLGNQQFVIPQQIANDLQSYLGLGQAASSLSGQLGALGLNENQQAMAGIGSALGFGSNLLFGNQGLSGALGLGNSGLLGGLFGGGGGAAASGLLTPGVGGAFATAPFTDLAAGGAAAAGGGSGLLGLGGLLGFL